MAKSKLLGIAPIGDGTGFELSKAGDLRIGVNTKGYPEAIDYFKCDSKYSDRFVPAIKQQIEEGLLPPTVNPERPDIVCIAFYSNDMREVCSTVYELREGRYLKAETDGTTFILYKKGFGANTPLTKEEYMQAENLRHDISIMKQQDFKARTQLKFIIPFFNVRGYFRVQTMGKETSIKNLSANFRQSADAYGDFFYKVPFHLKVDIHQSDSAEHKSRRYPVLSLMALMDSESVLKLHDSFVGELEQIKGIITPNKLQQNNIELRYLKPSEYEAQSTVIQEAQRHQRKNTLPPPPPIKG